MQIADQIILETYRFHMKKGSVMPYSFDLQESRMGPNDSEMEQRSIMNMFISYPS